MRTVAAALVAALVLHLVLIQPNHPDAVSWRALLLFPLELPVILLALVALGQSRAGACLRAAVVAVLTVTATLKSADFAMFVSLGRGFNPVGDLPLAVSLFQLAVGALGPVMAWLLLAVAIAAPIALAILLWWACAVWARLRRPVPAARVAGVAAVLAAGVAVAEIGATLNRWSLPVTPPITLPGTAFTARVAVERYQTVRETWADLRRFRTAAKEDELAGLPGLFDRVDRDVFLVFLESYGRASIDMPFYATRHLDRLREAERSLARAGYAMASTLVTAPTKGGQSWLSHASLANGLWVNSQTSYRAVLASGRRTLFHLAQEAGFHTAAVMPQITMDWPEARSMGFETILAARDLGYEGLPFNWITMPDQFTFAALDRLLPRANRPRFVQVATGSSHAPWVPVPRLLDWDALGDGTVFNPVVAASEPPRTVWQDHDRVRAQYREAIDYALETVFAYAARHAESAPLFLVIGDHQAAGFVALDERPHVPLHVIGPPHLVERLSDAEFAGGLIPPDLDAPRRMSALRSHIVRGLSSGQVARADQ